MLTVSQIEEVAKMVIAKTKTKEELLDTQFGSLGPGMSRMNDDQFYAWFVVNTQYHGEDEVPGEVDPLTGMPGPSSRVMVDPTRFAVALTRIPGGMKEIERWEKVSRTGKYGGLNG